ncbi:hypothetical protein GCM10007205_10710 [Oxalicibacterium flavum]|uniref:AlgX/AlgJ SGNH hydrolase-like domain-containing protein n=1 Tax=Oxalicibacterium flavum TaxID=179467 RepID=A0A8J2UQ15_9BURK|nr:twin-arginine translocation pathway signal [Oxalicibacterium flavum]GGC03372.1 hypothetical protein GCM10007205_10710 [Oxalicibacterium flavum]
MTIPFSMPMFLYRALIACVLSAAAIGVQADPVSPQNSTQLVIKGNEGWLFPGWGSLTVLDENGIDASVKLLAFVRHALAERGVRLEVLLLPDKVYFAQDKLPANRQVSPAVLGRYETILKKLDAAGMPILDVKALLQAEQKKGVPAYYRSDQHWTLPAAEATAVASAEFIKKQIPVLKGKAGTGLQLGAEVRERRFGDLAELFLSPEERKQIGRETYTTRRSVAGELLDESGPSPVHISGHSMVQPYFGFPQKLSQALDRPVSLNWKPGNVGPWMVLLEYLESDEFRKSPPQVLLWQIFDPVFSQGPDATGSWDSGSLMPPAQWAARVNDALVKLDHGR